MTAIAGTRRPRRTLLFTGVATIVAGLAAAPCLAFGFILAVPSLRGAKFFSEGDGSTGPAFDACLWAWGGLSVLFVVVGAVQLVVGLVKRGPST